MTVKSNTDTMIKHLVIQNVFSIKIALIQAQQSVNQDSQLAVIASINDFIADIFGKMIPQYNESMDTVKRVRAIGACSDSAIELQNLINDNAVDVCEELNYMTHYFGVDKEQKLIEILNQVELRLLDATLELF